MLILMVNIVLSFGFIRIAGSGSYRTYAKKRIPGIINLQEVKGQAKHYQVKQFIGCVKKYKLKPED
jgi:hypothetical protein